MAELLPDIPRGYTWSKEWMRITLARDVAKMPNETRLEFFRVWTARHGAESAAALEQEAKAEWQRLRSAASSSR